MNNSEFESSVEIYNIDEHGVIFYCPKCQKLLKVDRDNNKLICTNENCEIFNQPHVGMKYNILHKEERSKPIGEIDIQLQGDNLRVEYKIFKK